MKAENRLQELYVIARDNGLIHNKGDFATLIGRDPSTLSHLLKNDGKANFEEAIIAAEHALMKAGVSLDNYGKVTGQIRDANVQNGNNNQIGIPPKKFESEKEWFALVAEKDKQIDRLLAIIETITNTSK